MKGLATVVVNAEKPNKGDFIVTVKGKKVVELLAMPRPFGKLKALDMDAVVADIKSKLL